MTPVRNESDQRIINSLFSASRSQLVSYFIFFFLSILFDKFYCFFFSSPSSHMISWIALYFKFDRL